jgi:drug/metabolite transporter (DMT)-like permease
VNALVTTLVLCAALLHASWNAILRGGSDRYWSIVVICATSVVAALPVVFVVTPPTRACWPFLAGSAVLQDVACLLLVRGYRDGQLAQVYPIARGSSPLMVTLGAVIVAGEQPSVVILGGVALISAAIIMLALEKARPKPATLAVALAIGATISAYTLCDGLGARRSENVTAYTAWLFLIQGTSMPLLFAATRGWPPLAWPSADTWKAVVGGVFGLIAYGVAIWALSVSPMGRVSALRETSVLFAVVIGALFLKERPTPARVLAAMMIAAGAALLATTR